MDLVETTPISLPSFLPSLLPSSLLSLSFSHARGQIRAVATGPCHSNTWSSTSVTYSTAHSYAGSLTPWVRPGMEPVSSWMLVRFVTIQPQWGLPFSFLSNKSRLQVELSKNTQKIEIPSKIWNNRENNIRSYFNGPCGRSHLLPLEFEKSLLFQNENKKQRVRYKRVFLPFDSGKQTLRNSYGNETILF